MFMVQSGGNVQSGGKRRYEIKKQKKQKNKNKNKVEL